MKLLEDCVTRQEVIDYFVDKYGVQECDFCDDDYKKFREELQELMGAIWTSYTGYKDITEETMFECDIQMFVAGEWKYAKQIDALEKAAAQASQCIEPCKLLNDKHFNQLADFLEENKDKPSKEVASKLILEINEMLKDE